MSQYSFDLGFRFYYWPYYKTIDTNYQNTQLDRNHNDHNGYTPSQLYIEQKYKSLKEFMKQEYLLNKTVEI